MIQKIKKSNAGFTLVELIVVIAIIGILAAVLVPQYIGYVERSKQGVDISYMGEVAHNVAIEAAATAGSTSVTYNIDFTPTGSGTTKVADYTITATGTDTSALTTNVKKIVPPAAFKSTKFSGTPPTNITVTATGTVGNLPTAANS